MLDSLRLEGAPRKGQAGSLTRTDRSGHASERALNRSRGIAEAGRPTHVGTHAERRGHESKPRYRTGLDAQDIEATSVASSPDGRILAIGDSDGTIRLLRSPR